VFNLQRIFTWDGCRLLPYNDAVRMSAEIARRSWQRKWDQDASGFCTRQLIPKVGVKVSFPEKRDVGLGIS